MTIGFSTKWPKGMGDLAGQPNYFIQKIWCGLILNLGDEFDNNLYQERHKNKFGHYWRPEIDLPPKLHTIRDDPHNRWRPGIKIHPVINSRSKDRFQFAPTLACTGVQEIEIRWFRRETPVESWEGHVYNPQEHLYAHAIIDRRQISHFEMKHLAINDGFPSVEAFFMWFNKDFKGKIIHWTDLKY